MNREIISSNLLDLETPSWKTSVYLLVAGLLIFLCGAVATFITLRCCIYGYRSMQWPLATGTILSAEIHDRTHYSNERSGLYRVTKHHYEPRVRYSYTVNGTVYQGNRILFAPNLESFSHSLEDYNHYLAYRMVGNYETGKSVWVYYNPADPRQCTLHAGIHMGYLACFILVSVALLFVGSVFLYKGWRLMPLNN